MIFFFEVDSQYCFVGLLYIYLLLNEWFCNKMYSAWKHVSLYKIKHLYIARNEINNIFNAVYLNDNCNQEDILSKYTSFVFKALMKTFFDNANITMKIETPFSSCNLC